MITNQAHVPIAPQSHGLDVGSKLKLNDASALDVVPNHDFGGGKLGIAATTDQRNIIAPKQHLHNSNTAVCKFCAA